MATERIGKFELDLENVKCDPKIAASIKKVARKSATWNDVPGNAEHIKTYNQIFNLILQGKTKEIKAIYQNNPPAGSLSQVGPIMPKEAMLTYRKCKDPNVYVIKVEDKPARYMEKTEWMMENGMTEPDEDPRPGGIWECCRCGEPHAVAEPVLQHLCGTCAEETGKGKTGRAKKADSRVMLTKEIEKFAQGYLSRKGTDIGNMILNKINDLRGKVGLKPIDAKAAEAMNDTKSFM